MEIITKHEFFPPDIRNLFCAAFEGGSNYWAHAIEPVSEVPEDGSGLVFYGRAGFYGEKFAMKITHDDPDNDGKQMVTTIDQDSVRRGLQKLADDYPSHIADLILDEGDGDTGDAFLQCAVLGDIVFG